MTMQGNRRIDRVLAEDFLTSLTTLPIAELRERRGEAEQEEVDLSYLRRIVQGRMDILRAELERRSAPEGASLVDSLPQILGDEARTGARGLGRHAAVEPSRADAHRRYVESLVADVDLSDVSQRSDDELTRSLAILEAEEHQISEQRHSVQVAMDACAAELTRRYRDGEADVADLLPE